MRAQHAAFAAAVVHSYVCGGDFQDPLGVVCQSSACGYAARPSASLARKIDARARGVILGAQAAKEARRGDAAPFAVTILQGDAISPTGRDLPHETTMEEKLHPSPPSRRVEALTAKKQAESLSAGENAPDGADRENVGAPRELSAWPFQTDRAWDDQVKILEARLLRGALSPWPAESAGDEPVGLLPAENALSISPMGTRMQREDQWCTDQKALHACGLLSPRRVRRLESLPNWEWRPSTGWEDTFRQLFAYARDRGELPTRNAHRTLGVWAANQRANHRRGRLLDFRARALEKIPGWYWCRHNAGKGGWRDMLRLLEQYAEEHRSGFSGRGKRKEAGPLEDDGPDPALPAPVSPDGGSGKNALFSPSAGQERARRKTPLAKRVRNRPKAEDAIPLPSAIYRGEHLGTWCRMQRDRHSFGQMPAELERALETVTGWTWYAKCGCTWDDAFDALWFYIRAYEDLPGKNGFCRGVPLGRWCRLQRELYAAEELGAERAARLETVPGWWWKMTPVPWKKAYRSLVHFVAEHGRVPEFYEQMCAGVSGRWCGVQRRRRAEQKLEQEKISMLEAVPGWRWSGPPGDHGDSVEDWNRTLERVQRRHQAARERRAGGFSSARGLPGPDELAEFLALSAWCRRQRRKHARGLLMPAQAEKFEALARGAAGWSQLQSYDGFLCSRTVSPAPALWRRRLGQGKEAPSALSGAEQQSESQEGRRPGGAVGSALYRRNNRRAGDARRRQQQADGSLEENGLRFPLPRSEKTSSRVSPDSRFLTAREKDWEGFYRLARAYFVCGAEVPDSERPEAALSDGAKAMLAEWCQIQSLRRALGMVHPFRAEKLEALSRGARWRGEQWEEWTRLPFLDREEEWHTLYLMLREYTRIHPYRLPQFFDREDVLPSSPFRQSRSSLSESTDSLISPAREQEPPLLASVGGGELGGRYLGEWCARQRDLHRAGCLDADRARRLEGIAGWWWEDNADRTRFASGGSQTDEAREWQSRYAALAAHVHARPECLRGDAPDGPRSFMAQSGLGSWCERQRRSRAAGGLDAEKTALLGRLPGWDWTTSDSKWQTRFGLVKEYARAFGRLPVQETKYNRVWLGKWCQAQRTAHARGALEHERVRALESLGEWNWSLERDWNMSFAMLCDYVEKKHALPAAHARLHCTYLGRWCQRQRMARSRGTLTPEREALLLELGFFQESAHAPPSSAVLQE